MKDRVIVSGCIVRVPLAGMAWHYLQYVLGLKELGYDVWYVEDSGDDPWCCYDPKSGTTGPDATYGLGFAARLFEENGLQDRWAYFDTHGRGWCGPAGSSATKVCSTADVLLNVSETAPLRSWFEHVPIRVLIDTDPAFTQIRHLSDPKRKAQASGHTHFWTFAGCIGMASCTVPDDGFPWRPTRQPVVTSAWPVVPILPGARFSTIMQWESYPARVHGGVTYGLKSDSFGPYIDLPQRLGFPLDLGLGSSTAPRLALQAAGWNLLNPEDLTDSTTSYQRFIQQSTGEFSIAKAGYVTTHSGWFSERSCAYLASGRPVILQDTGFPDWLPTGRGLLTFSNPDGAVRALEEVRGNLDRHSRAARELASDVFDAARVLGSLPTTAKEH